MKIQQPKADSTWPYSVLWGRDSAVGLRFLLCIHPIEASAGCFLPSQIVNSVESWLKGKVGWFFFASSWSSSKCTEMHTSQTHTKPNRLRLRLTGIGLWTYHVTKLFVCSSHLLCKGRRPHHWRRGICREIHAKGTAAMLINKEEKCPGCFLQWKVDRRFRTKLSPLALTMQGWHTGLFVRIRGRTVTSAGGFDKFTLASFWTKYKYCWVSISYWKINWIRVAENEC